MPRFIKRNDQYQWRAKRNVNGKQKERCESLPLNTPMAKVREQEGLMNAAYYSGQWDPLQLSWAEFQGDPGNDDRITVSRAVNMFIADRIHRGIIGKTTAKQYRYKLDMFSDWLGPAFDCSRLETAHAGNWLHSMDVAQGTLNDCGSKVSKFYDWLVDQGLTDRPFKYHGSYNNDRADTIKYLTEAQKNAMCKQYRDNRSSYVGWARPPKFMDYDDLIQILFYQGFRSCEIFKYGITRGAVNLTEQTITVRGKGRGRAGKTRTPVIMPPALPFIRKAYLGTTHHSDNLFPHSYWAVQRVIKELAKDALGPQYDWVSLHNLRHSCGTHLAGKEVPVEVIRKILGHSSIATTMTYVNITDQTSRKAIEKAFA